MFANPYSSLFGKPTTPQHKKDFQKLESAMVKSCAYQCLRKERHYNQDSEVCMAKCYDLLYIYTKIGMNELNNFTVENSLDEK